ncbi:cytochrome-c peroxidase [Hymenobacter sp. GOD-10R]|uniref:cytochrome-c peroxidase n=1 Tax=Hymenobacter sp. GOD-10R TaxID=3093922 RepID=UPI002D788C36|nr:cytochrome c peroxidase [Hymenobacter sp. GOD-10R]WRQ26547.1 cytochrome c peroxidase [Hymenobacter sp. GOD-10R]
MISITAHLQTLGRPLLLGFAVLLFSCTVLRKTPTEQVKDYYDSHLAQLHTAVLRFLEISNKADAATLRANFTACRAEYKRLEFAIEYYYPNAAQRLNGAVLPEAEPSEPEQVVPPTGFQVLEEYVYDSADDPASHGLICQELENILYQVRYLQAQAPALTFSEAEIFDAVRLNLYRLAVKGISGFDSPVAFASLPEAAITLEGVGEVLSYFELPLSLKVEVERSITDVRTSGTTVSGFNQFDRAAFLVRDFKPLLSGLHAMQRAKSIVFLQTRRAIRPTAVSLFAADAFDPMFFAPSDAAPATPEILALGKALFQEPALSGEGRRTCASCHIPDRAYTDGLKVNSSLLPDVTLKRNTPTLLNASLQPAQFYDGRVLFLEDQIHEVVSNKAEMGGHLDEVTNALRRKKSYSKQFSKAFPNEDKPLTERNIRKALAAYIRSLIRLNSRFDQYMRGDTTILSESEVDGFNLFMGKAKCGTCHYMPLFNGAVAPLYDKIESEVLGVLATTDTIRPSLDTDEGKYLLHKIAHQRYAFKTPTIRNANHTAPYMHNGVYLTLKEVIDFYNKGGGAGLGLEVSTQTLGEDQLRLTKKERQSLIDFIGSLSDIRE